MRYNFYYRCFVNYTFWIHKLYYDIKDIHENHRNDVFMCFLGNNRSHLKLLADLYYLYCYIFRPQKWKLKRPTFVFQGINHFSFISCHENTVYYVSSLDYKSTILWGKMLLLEVFWKKTKCCAIKHSVFIYLFTSVQKCHMWYLRIW